MPIKHHQSYVPKSTFFISNATILIDILEDMRWEEEIYTPERLFVIERCLTSLKQIIAFLSE